MCSLPIECVLFLSGSSKELWRRFEHLRRWARMPYARMPYVRMPYVRMPNVRMPYVRMPYVAKETY